MRHYYRVQVRRWDRNGIESWWDTLPGSIGEHDTALQVVRRLRVEGRHAQVVRVEGMTA